MQKNWYIVYTKAKCEKKVVGLLAKRKIEHFCPLNCKQIKHPKKNKLHYEPLFNSYVFVKIKDGNIFLLKQVEGVVGLVYWKGNPAIIKDEEIGAIKDFTANHRNIKLERIKVNVNEEARSVDNPSYTMDGKLLIVKTRSFNVNLPSMGYTMIAEIESDNIMDRKISFDSKELLLQ